MAECKTINHNDFQAALNLINRYYRQLRKQKQCMTFFVDYTQPVLVAITRAEAGLPYEAPTSTAPIGIKKKCSIDDDNTRYKVESNKSLIYDNTTNTDVCMYFDDTTKDMLLNLLNEQNNKP